jgi:hypothetical protein
MQQALLAHDAVNREFRAYVVSLFEKDRHDLIGCEIGKTWIIDSVENLLALFLAEPMHDMPRRPLALIAAESLGLNHQAPSPQCACRQAKQISNGLSRNATIDAFLQQCDDRTVILRGDQGSSSG